MRVQWAMLANAVEVRDGLVNMLGGGWDSIAVTRDPVPGAPTATMRGHLVLRILLGSDETGREHPLDIRVVDADGGVRATVSGTFSVPASSALPIGWEQGIVMSFDLSGTRLESVGGHEVTVLIGGEAVHSVPFQVVDRRA